MASASALISSQLLEDLDVVGRRERFLELFEPLARGVERARTGGCGGDLRRTASCRVVALDRFENRRFGGDDRLDVVARHELDVVHREDVGGIRHRERERGARAGERHDLVLVGRVGGNELDDARVDLELGEVDRRDAVLAAEERGDLFVLDEAETNEIVTEFSPVGLLMVQGLLELLRGDAFLLEEEFADADGHVSFVFNVGGDD
ncbi:MAG: hypothetical protein QM736_21465 [Vicinamibacterales bacterium]